MKSFESDSRQPQAGNVFLTLRCRFNPAPAQPRFERAQIAAELRSELSPADGGVVHLAEFAVRIVEEPTADKRIEKCIGHMVQNLDKPPDVAALSAAAGMSPSNFYLLFRRATGQSPLAFLTRARMRLACMLLENTSLQVKQIAQDLGYSDPFYFSRLFKVIHGVAPLWYRVYKRAEHNE